MLLKGRTPAAALLAVAIRLSLCTTVSLVSARLPRLGELYCTRRAGVRCLCGRKGGGGGGGGGAALLRGSQKRIVNCSTSLFAIQARNPFHPLNPAL